MKAFPFPSGAFVLSPAALSVHVDGAPMRWWALSYDRQAITAHYCPLDATEFQVRETFADDIVSWSRLKQWEGAPDILHLVNLNGDILARIAVSTWPAGMSAGLTDDRHPTWLVSGLKPTRSMPCTIEEFSCIERALPRRWIANLLPDEVLASDPEEWRAPTSWEIRHVVGEESFTGVSGAQAAKLAGVTPQNFRKYTAADGSRTQQQMSYAMWHLLLHKLGVKAA